MRSHYLGRSLRLDHNLIRDNIFLCFQHFRMSDYLEFLVRQFSVSVFVREVEHFLDVNLRDGHWQTPHDVLEVLLGDEVFV